MGFLDDPKPENKEPEKIKIGDQEFTPEEAQELLNVGRTAKELESKYNTKLDSVWPAYGQSQTQLKKLQEDFEKYKAEAEAKIRDSAPKDKEPDAEDPRVILENAAKMGFITRESLVREYQTLRQAEKLMERGSKLEADLNPYKSPDLPKFNSQEIFEYMNQNGYKDPEQAYKLKYEKEIDDWKAKELSSRKPSSAPKITPSTDGKQPAPQQVNRGNLKDFIRVSVEGE